MADDDDRRTDGPPSEEPGDQPRDSGDTQAWEPDETGQTQAWEPDEAGQTQAWEPDQTAPLPGGAPRGPDDTTVEPAATAWSGRARVPTPGYDDTGQVDEPWEAEERQGGPWWLPVLVAAIALVVLGMLGAGIWLIADALREDPAPVPTPSPTVTDSPTPTPAPETPPPPAPEPTPEQPSPTPSPTPPSPTPPSPTPPSPTPGPTASG